MCPPSSEESVTGRSSSSLYSDDLAAKFSNDCRAVMRTDWYKQTFPRARIDKAKDTESEVRTRERGYRLATSVGGTLTGRGGDIIIIDDPIKPQAWKASCRSARTRFISMSSSFSSRRMTGNGSGASQGWGPRNGLMMITLQQH